MKRHNLFYKMKLIGFITLVIGVLIINIFPIIWGALTSIKEPCLTFSIPPALFFKPTLENFYTVFEDQPFTRFTMNSIIISLGATFLALLLGALSAYSFSIFKSRIQGVLLFITLAIRMLPPVAAVIPIYQILRGMGLLDTHLAMILVNTTFNISFVIWMLKGFFDEIPTDLINCSLIDGCSYLRSFFAITLPIALPGLVATALFTFIQSWNDFMFALVLTSTNAKTLPVVASGFITEEGISWGQVGAGGTLILLPVIIFSFLLQKHLVRGMTAGAVKG